MTDETKIVELAKRRKVKYTDDPIGTLQEALDCARENGIAAVCVAMVDADRGDFYLVSAQSGSATMLGALDRCKQVVREKLIEVDE